MNFLFNLKYFLLSRKLKQTIKRDILHGFYANKGDMLD